MLAWVPLAFVIAVLTARPVARRLSVAIPVAFLLVLAAVGILAITLIPQPDGRIAATDATCLLPTLSVPAGGRLFPLSDESLNVVLFVPLGIALGLMAGHPAAPRIAVLAVALPWAIEATQLVVPGLGRTCQSADLTANLVGLVFGVVTALASRFLGSLGRAGEP